MNIYLFQGTVLSGESRRGRQPLNSELTAWGKLSKLVLATVAQCQKNTDKLITILLRDVVKKKKKKKVGIMSYMNIDEEPFNSAYGRQRESRECYKEKGMVDQSLK